MQSVALSKLIRSAQNVRKTGGQSIEDLAASIAAHGLLQSLVVVPAPKGKYEVVAGGRRLAALHQLARQGTIAKDHPVPVQIIAPEAATEASLAENVIRTPMHPADQFEAFRALIETGAGIEDVAARFGVTPTFVRQRLKLAAVSPRLMEAYRNDELTLDQLMAFTVIDDHAAQERAWFDAPHWDRQPWSLKRRLTDGEATAGDRRAVFVGLAAYEAAGGFVRRDLFNPQAAYLPDIALLDRLFAEKLEAEAEAIRAEGWAWVEVWPTWDYRAYHSYRRVFEPEDGWTDNERSRAGAIVSVWESGELRVERGLLRDDPALSDKAKDPAARKPAISAALTETLTAHRTLALRAVLATRPDIALVAVTHALTAQVLYDVPSYRLPSALEIRADRFAAALPPKVDDLDGTPAAQQVDAQKAAWTTRLPADVADLWPWLLEQSHETVMALLAFVTAQTVNAVSVGMELQQPRLAAAEKLAEAVDLDMADWWTPTAEGYFGRVTKERILEAIREADSPAAADELAGMKKSALAEEAERRLSASRWLPPILRRRQDEADELHQAAE